MDPTDQLRRTMAWVAALNLSYFVIEFGVALSIGSASLLADSADFFEDASVNLLVLAALRWSPARRARVGMLLAGVLLAPAAAFAGVLLQQLHGHAPPRALPLSATGAGALAVNLTCAFALARLRHHAGSLTNAAFLSARNDAAANVAIIAAGGLTALTRSVWPDLLVGLGIAVMNIDAARAIWRAAREEHRLATKET